MLVALFLSVAFLRQGKMLALKFFLLLLRPVPLLSTMEIGLELFLQSRVPSSTLYLYHTLQDVADKYLDWKAISAYAVEDFMRQHPTWSETCAAFQLRTLELVIVEPLPFRTLRRVLPKLSYCIRRAPWKPVVLIQWSIEEGTGDNGKNVTIMENLLSAAQIPLDSNVFLFTMRRGSLSKPTHLGPASAAEQNSTLIFWEIYTIKHGPFIRKVSIDATAAQNTVGFEILTFLRGVACRRKDFNRVVVSGVTQNDPTYSLESRLELVNGSLRFDGGVAVEMFQDLEAALNFVGKPIEGTGWLAMDEVTGQWIGVGKQVISGQADVCVSLLANTAVRGDTLSRLKLLIPTLRGRMKAFFIQPDASEMRDIFKHPIGTQVWILIAFLLIFTFLLIKISNFLRNCIHIHEEEEMSEIETNSVLVLVAIACQQGWFINPASSSMKILSFSISLAAFILYVSFSAAIVSTLTLEVVPISSFGTLKASHLNLVGDVVVPKVATILGEIYGTDGQTLENRGVLYDIDSRNPVERISDGSTAHVGLADEFVSLYRRSNGTGLDFCRTISAVDVKGEVYSSMFVTLGSPFKESFNFGILRTMERGLNSCRSRRYNRKANIKCEQINTRYRNDLGIADVKSAYMILILGYCLSVVILAIEKFVQSCGIKLHTKRVAQDEQWEPS